MTDSRPGDEQDEDDLEITDLRDRPIPTTHNSIPSIPNRLRLSTRTSGMVMLVASIALLLVVLLSSLPVLRNKLRQLVVAPATPTASAVSETSSGGIVIQLPFSTALPTASTAATVLPPTPTDVPAGWTVFVGWHFSIAYPPGWTLQYPQSDSTLIYSFAPPNPQNQGVELEVISLPPSATTADVAPYCLSSNNGIQEITFAGLPMAYGLAGEGSFMRTWTFVNTQHIEYRLDALDEQGTAAVQEQDVSILLTFRPDSSTPWHC